jgi:hypothetical protein
MLQPTWYPTNRQLRQFAVVALFGFGLMGLITRWQFHLPTAAYVLWTLGALTFLAGLPAPTLILPVYAALCAVAFPIGWLVSNILLRVIFYGLFTPVGLVMRMLGRDPLQLKRPNVASYWLPFRQARSPLSYYRQA